MIIIIFICPLEKATGQANAKLSYYFLTREKPWWLKNYRKEYRLFGSAPYFGRPSL